MKIDPDKRSIAKKTSMKVQLWTSFYVRRFQRMSVHHSFIADLNFFFGKTHFGQGKRLQWMESTVPKLDKAHSDSCHKRQKLQAPTPQAPIRNRQTRKVANAIGLNCNANLT